MFGDISDAIIGDFGTGTGILGIACSLLDASFVAGFDIDPNAIELAQENAIALGVNEDIDYTLTNLATTTFAKDSFDTVVMNPPFGTRETGIDMVFLFTAIKSSRVSVYSLHKSSTRAHVLKMGEQWGAPGKVLATLKFDIKKTFAFHKKNSADVEVDFIRFEVGANPAAMPAAPAYVPPEIDDSRHRRGGGRQRKGRGRARGEMGGRGKRGKTKGKAKGRRKR